MFHSNHHPLLYEIVHLLARVVSAGLSTTLSTFSISYCQGETDNPRITSIFVKPTRSIANILGAFVTFNEGAADPVILIQGFVIPHFAEPLLAELKAHMVLDDLANLAVL